MGTLPAHLIYHLVTCLPTHVIYLGRKCLHIFSFLSLSLSLCFIMLVASELLYCILKDTLKYFTPWRKQTGEVYTFKMPLLHHSSTYIYRSIIAVCLVFSYASYSHFVIPESMNIILLAFVFSFHCGFHAVLVKGNVA